MKQVVIDGQAIWPLAHINMYTGLGAGMHFLNLLSIFLLLKFHGMWAKMIFRLWECHLEPLPFFLHASAGDLHLFPVPVKTQSGEKLELQVSYLLIELLHYFSFLCFKLVLFKSSVKYFGSLNLAIWALLMCLIDLKLNPGDSVMDIRQILLEAHETCFFTCYDLLLHTKDGSTHHLEDFNEISEVADITSGGCSLEMVPGIY